MILARVIATVGYVGYLPRAPGTWGSLVALPLANLLHWVGSFPALLVGTLVAYVAGHWAVAIMTKGGADHDPSEVVIDEVVGQWIALWPLSGGLWYAGSSLEVFPWPGVVGAFVFFRLFDILKPWPISRIDRIDTPAGVMLDDVVAGIFAAILVAASAALAHIWLV